MAFRRRASLLAGSVLIVVGALGTGWFLLTDTFGGVAAVRCTDPEAWACSGHYVHGVANEVWTLSITALGVVAITISRILERPPARLDRAST